MEIILFCLGVIGLTHIIVDSKITMPLRTWMSGHIPFISEIMSCYQCCGLYCGLFCGWAVFTDINFWQILICGFAGSFLSAFAALNMNYLEAQTIVNLEDK